MYLELERRGAENINLVTGTQFTPTILAALRWAKQRGMKIPVVWNSSGFETEDTVGMLSEEIDIFLPDCKTLSEETSRFLFQTRSYPGYASKSIASMAGMKPEISQSRGVITEGVIVRHLVLPGHLDETKEVIDWFQRELKDNCFFSLLGQYTPVPASPAGNLSRGLTRDEYQEAVEYLLNSKIEEGYVQDFSHDSGWLPDFREKNPFPSSQSITLWSCGR
jgi:putative pyruvate formate lyase activating enzyme